MQQGTGEEGKLCFGTVQSNRAKSECTLCCSVINVGTWFWKAVHWSCTGLLICWSHYGQLKKTMTIDITDITDIIDITFFIPHIGTPFQNLAPKFPTMQLSQWVKQLRQFIRLHAATSGATKGIKPFSHMQKYSCRPVCCCGGYLLIKVSVKYRCVPTVITVIECLESLVSPPPARHLKNKDIF